MSYLPNRFSLSDGPQLDAFNRLRISNPQTIFSSTQEYTADPLHMENYTSNGSATYNQASASTTLSTVASTANYRALRQSKVYWRYQAGKSQVIKLTGTLAKSGTPSGAAVARIGYFDDNNGIFFGRDATGYFAAIRTNVSGVVLETEKYYQSSWNVDKMTGSGPSGVTIDFTKEQIFFIDLQWLGVGRVRVGLVLDGVLRYVHYFEHANLTTAVYMRTACLPVRYEVFNSGGAGSVITLEAVCCAIESEGGVADEGGYTFEFDNNGAPITAADSTTLTPIMTIRCRDTFGGLTYRGHCHQINVAMLVSKDTYYELKWNVATLTSGGGAVNELTAGTWANVDGTYSGMEYNVAATAQTGGVAIGSGFISAAGSGSKTVGSTSDQVPNKLILARTYANTRDTLTLVARGLGASSSIYATMNFEEQY